MSCVKLMQLFFIFFSCFKNVVGGSCFAFWGYEAEKHLTKIQFPMHLKAALLKGAEGGFDYYFALLSC